MMHHLRAAFALALLSAGLAFGQLTQSGAPTPPVQCNNWAFVEATSSSKTVVVAGQASRSVYVCGFLMNSGGNVTLRLVGGAGNNCASSVSHLTPAFKMTNGSNVQFGSATGVVFKVPAGHSLCLASSGSPDVNVLVTYAQF